MAEHCVAWLNNKNENENKIQKKKKWCENTYYSNLHFISTFFMYFISILWVVKFFCFFISFVVCIRWKLGVGDRLKEIAEFVQYYIH